MYTVADDDWIMYYGAGPYKANPEVSRGPMLDALYEKEPFITHEMERKVEAHPELKKVLHKYRDEE